MLKRFATTLAASVLAAVPLAAVAPAHAVSGTCDPATRGVAYNEMQQANGPIDMYVRYGWDGVTVLPDCDGPVLLLRGTNTSATETWYVHFQGRKGTWRVVALAPGQVVTVTSSGTLKQMGLSTRLDLEGLLIDQTSTPEPAA